MGFNNCFFLVIITLIVNVYSKILETSDLLQALGIGGHVSVKIELNDETNLVTIELSGSASTYFAIGFSNGLLMLNTYTIIALGDGTVEERLLGITGVGTLLESSLTIVSNVVENGLRTLILQRPIIGKNLNYYTFSLNTLILPIIYAYSTILSTLDSLGLSNRNTAILNFFELPDLLGLLSTNTEQIVQYLDSPCNCDHYTYVIEQVCLLCDPCFTYSKLVEVNLGKVVAVTFLDATLSTTLCNNYVISLTDYYTIEQLLQQIDDLLDQNPISATISYSTCGCPIELNVDISANVGDEITWSLSNFICIAA